jgi:hypothetical protein
VDSLRTALPLLGFIRRQAPQERYFAGLGLPVDDRLVCSMLLARAKHEIASQGPRSGRISNDNI